MTRSPRPTNSTKRARSSAGRLALAAIFLALASCAGTPFEWSDTSKIRNGMTEAEVVTVLGKPYQRSQSGNTAVLTWSYSAMGQGAKAVSYRFVDGRVVGLATVGK